jgi:hypothetical protein
MCHRSRRSIAHSSLAADRRLVVTYTDRIDFRSTVTIHIGIALTKH